MTSVDSNEDETKFDEERKFSFFTAVRSFVRSFVKFKIQPMMKLRRRPLCSSNSTRSPSLKRKRSRKVSQHSDNDENQSIVLSSDDESKEDIVCDQSSSSDEYVESESDEDEEIAAPIVQQQKTRMVTRQMSLIMNNQLKVKIQPFVDHTEDSLSSETSDSTKSTRLRPRRGNVNGSQFFVRTAPIDDDDTSQPAAFSSIKKETFFYYTTPQRPDENEIDYEQLVNRTRIKPASMDQCHQGQLLPEESIETGHNSRPNELIPYLLELEQNLMPKLAIVKHKTKKSATPVVYQKRVQILLDYLYGIERCEQISELIRLHLRSRLVLNTLFLTVNLFDRSILTGKIPRETYTNGNPILLLTCLLIAGKFEEVEWPSITSLIGNRENLRPQDIKSLEIVVLQSLSFDIGLTVLDFVYRYCEIFPMDQSNDDLRLLFFILQLLLIDPHTFLAHKSSYIAACTYALVRHLKKYEVTWPRRLVRSTGYDPTEIAYGVTKVARQCLRALSSNDDQQTIHRELMMKYSKGPARQLIEYEQALNDLVQPSNSTDD